MEKKTDRRGRIIREEIPFTGIREVIGKRMTESLHKSPQGSVSARYDVSKLAAFRQELKAKGQTVSFTDLFVKIVAVAVKELPVMNSTLENGVITVYDTVNVGIAVQVDDILVVPVLNNVQEKSIEEISRDSKEMIDNARNRRFDKLYMDGATITVNNLGMFYIDSCTPIVNYPETAILGIGKISKEAWVGEDGAIEVRDAATLSLSINHAVVDGGQTGAFMRLMKNVLDAPELYIK